MWQSLLLRPMVSHAARSVISFAHHSLSDVHVFIPYPTFPASLTHSYKGVWFISLFVFWLLLFGSVVCVLNICLCSILGSVSFALAWCHPIIHSPILLLYVFHWPIWVCHFSLWLRVWGAHGCVRDLVCTYPSCYFQNLEWLCMLLTPIPELNVWLAKGEGPCNISIPSPSSYVRYLGQSAY